MVYFDPDRLTELDREAIARYHATPGLKEKYRLHTELGPQPFEGDVANARIVIPMNNPGFGDTSTPDDHRFDVDGWPLASLHEDAPAGMRGYIEPRLRDLITEFGAQRVSQRLALLQFHPWASVGYDPARRFVLPSMALAIGHARAALDRGALVLIGRGATRWRAALALRQDERYEARPPINPTWNRHTTPPEVYEQMRERLA